MIKLAPGDLAALPARGEDPSLESIALRRKLAAALMAKAADTSPVGHWTQALARGLQGWGGYLQDQQADKQDKGLRKDANAALLQLLTPSVTGGASPTAYPPQPAVSQAQEAMLPEQPMTPDQQGVASFAQGMGTPNMAASIPKVAGAMEGMGQGGPARNAAFDMSKIAASLGPEALPRPNASMFDFMKSDPNYVDRTGGGANRDPGSVNKVILHDRGGNYNGSSPYHVEVLPDGKIVNSWRPDQKAPHAYRSNPTSVGVAYGGQVGAKPTPQAMASLQKVVNGLKDQNPDLEVDSHGEAFRDTRGTPMQASKLGRGLDEASWRSELRNPVQAPPQMAAQPAAARPAQVADASGQSVDRATLERMLANPYSRDAALKILQSQAPPSQEQRMNLELKQAQIDALRAKSQGGGDAQRAQRMQMLQDLKIDPNSAEGKAVLINGKLPAAAYEQLNQRQLRTSAAPKIGEGLSNLSKMTEQYDDASFENSVGPFQGATPDGLFSAGPINAARLWGEVRNWWDGGKTAPSEVRSNIHGSTEALAAAIKPLIRAPGEGVWTDQDQARLVSVVGDLAQARDKPEFERRLEAVRERIKANFNLDIPGGKLGGGWSIQKVQ